MAKLQTETDIRGSSLLVVHNTRNDVGPIGPKDPEHPLAHMYVIRIKEFLKQYEFMVAREMT